MITFVHADDWVAVYNDSGECIDQNHSIDPGDLLINLGFAVRVINADKYAEEAGRFPDKLEDLPAEGRESEYVYARAAVTYPDPEKLAEEWMTDQFKAERTVTALDGFLAGWHAHEESA